MSNAVLPTTGLGDVENIVDSQRSDSFHLCSIEDPEFGGTPTTRTLEPSDHRCWAGPRVEAFSTDEEGDKRREVRYAATSGVRLVTF